MIYVNRNRDDVKGNKISPDEDWFVRAEAATELVIANPGDHDFDRNIYAADVVRAALEELFHYKCGYCEMPLPETFDVEHFRPKGRVAEHKDHPGYYWLAYIWANLLPSCDHCNRRRKDKPVWEDMLYASTGGKFDQFPLVDENMRAMNPEDCLAFEDHLMLDPCTDNPEKHIVYLTNGEIIGNDKYGETTIRICHLKRRRPRKSREKVIKQTIKWCQLVCELRKKNKILEMSRIEEVLKETLLSDKCQFAGAARCVVNRPELFGI